MGCFLTESDRAIEKAVKDYPPYSIFPGSGKFSGNLGTTKEQINFIN